MKKILITGASGQLGRSFINNVYGKYHILGTARNLVDGIPFSEGDISDRSFITKIIAEFSPDIIVHFASMTNVDKCEMYKSDANKVNVKPVEWILNVYSGYFVYISTDYVFDGVNGPYLENDQKKPINEYGRTKLKAESLIQSQSMNGLILRTNVLFDYTVWTGASFVNWLVKSLKNRKSITVVTDQFNNPIWTTDLANILIELIEKEVTGLYHTGGDEYISRYEFAKMIAQNFKLDASLILPISTGELNQKAKRPLKGGLKTEKIEDVLGVSSPSLEKALKKIISSE
ncbi:MAG: NAD(P)-dependent oxidoreductase [Candidatus Marinimicrobia bacterium]|nr:NAD(P)-dependent oxidoreductase [Candidatus Neomarinimicrobiota bacterium]